MLQFSGSLFIVHKETSVKNLLAQHREIQNLFYELITEPWWIEYRSLALFCQCLPIADMTTFRLGRTVRGKLISCTVLPHTHASSKLIFSVGNNGNKSPEDALRLLLSPITELRSSRRHINTGDPRMLFVHIIVCIQSNLQKMRDDAVQSNDHIALRQIIAFERKHYPHLTELLGKYQSELWRHYSIFTWFMLRSWTAIAK